MRVAIAADHAGLPLKADLIEVIKDAGHEALDLGTNAVDPVDYPAYAELACEAVRSGKVDRAVILCGSGVGVGVVANKFPGIRAGVCHDHYSAHQGVEHDDMNVICLGGRIIGSEVAREIVASFLRAKFSGEERHERRLNKTLSIETKFLKSK